MLISKADILTLETSVLCTKKPSHNSEFQEIKYRSSKGYRNPFRNTMATALGVATDTAIISVNKIPMTQMSTTVPATRLTCMQRAQYWASLVSSAALGVPTLVQRSLDFSVFSQQAWYKYLILLISLSVVKLSVVMRTKLPVIFSKTTNVNETDTWRLPTSKMTPTIQKRIVYSQPSAPCKKSARIIPFVHSSPGISSHTKFRLLPSLRATSLCTLLSLIFLETVLLSTVSNCAKTFYMHWNTSNSIFRIDNTDHIIDVNKGNLAFEFDQVHIICPVYEPGTFENETEKYIIYNVSKVEYETCRITNADPRVIAICDKPQKLMFFTITFRPFTPQPGGLEFLPGNDYYFISTSSKDDLYRRIGGRCSTNNMKVVFKVCCAVDENNKTTSTGATSSMHSAGSNTAGAVSIGISNSSPDGMTSGIDISANSEVSKAHPNLNQHMNNNANTIGTNSVTNGLVPIGSINIGSTSDLGNVDIQTKSINGASGTSINTNIDQFNRIPIQAGGINVLGSNVANVGNIALGGHGSGVTLTSGGHGGINMISAGGGTFSIGQYPIHPGQTGIRVNNVASQHHATHKSIDSNDDRYDKHPNEVVKNEELTYNSGAIRIQPWTVLKVVGIATSWPIFNMFERLLVQCRGSLSSVSTNIEYKEDEEKLVPQFASHGSYYFREKGKRHNKANVKFLTFNLNKPLTCLIVVFAITIFMIRISLNSRKSQNDNAANKPTTMKSLSNENAIVPHSLLEKLHFFVNRNSVFIEFKSFVQPGSGRLTSLEAKETIVSTSVCQNTQLSKIFPAKKNNSKINISFLSNSVNQPLIKYCHSQVSSVNVKVKRFR